MQEDHEDILGQLTLAPPLVRILADWNLLPSLHAPHYATTLHPQGAGAGVSQCSGARMTKNSDGRTRATHSRFEFSAALESAAPTRMCYAVYGCRGRR